MSAIRLSSNTIFTNGIHRLNTLQSTMNRTGEQVATGRKLLTAADDPIAAARILEVSQADAVNTQFQVNRDYAESSLSQVESILSNVTDLLQDIKSISVAAGNPAYADADRKSLATELRGKLEDLLGLANTADGTGNYLFSGYKATTQPFIRTADGARYEGAQGQRMLQVASSRQIAITDSGVSIFENNRTGNGTFTTQADAANAGTGVINLGAVTDTALLTRESYEVVYNAGLYDVINTTTGVPVSVGNAFTSGAPIDVDGMRFEITGTPADGDRFTVKPSGTQSVFTTLTKLIEAIEAPTTGPVAHAKLRNALIEADANMTSSLDNVLKVRSQAGANLKELDYLTVAGSDLELQYARTLADLQSLDYNKALSNLAQQKFTLEAAQKSFATVTGLSLFNYIP